QAVAGRSEIGIGLDPPARRRRGRLGLVLVRRLHHLAREHEAVLAAPYGDRLEIRWPAAEVVKTRPREVVAAAGELGGRPRRGRGAGHGGVGVGTLWKYSCTCATPFAVIPFNLSRTCSSVAGARSRASLRARSATSTAPVSASCAGQPRSPDHATWRTLRTPV